MVKSLLDLILKNRLTFVINIIYLYISKVSFYIFSLKFLMNEILPKRSWEYSSNGYCSIAELLNSDFLLTKQLTDIPQMFSVMPEWFRNDLAYWGWNMSDEEINETLPDWTKKFTHLDMDLWTDCVMKCHGCFKCIPGIRNKQSCLFSIHLLFYEKVF